MRYWIDIYDPNGTERLGDGPVFIRSAQIRRGLDETGSGSVSLAGVDPRVLALVQPRRVCELWAHEQGFAMRMIGSFVIEGDTHTLADGTNVRGVNGRSAMVELVNTIVLPGARYDAQTVQSVVDDLCGLVGWTATVDAAIANDLISVQFGGGENVLRALQVIAEIKGVHLREAADVTRRIKIGAFGEAAGVWIEYIEGDGGEIHRRSTSPMLIEQLSINEESTDIFNWCLGFAGGSGDAAIDLGLSTRPFVDSVSANGRTHYIIKDDASIATYGKIQRRVDAKRIIPTDTTDSALQYAADAAADAIKAKLDRHRVPQEVLTVSLRNVRQTIRPGDKIHLAYQGIINKNHLPYKYCEIDADYWVMRASEVVQADGIVLQLTISNIDRYRQDAAGVIVGMMDKIQAQEVDVQPYPAILNWGPFQQPIDNNEQIIFPFPIYSNVLRLNSVKATIIRDVWTAVASSAAAGGGSSVSSASGGGNSVSSAGGGDHNHRMLTYQGFASGVSGAERNYIGRNSSGGTSFLVTMKSSTDFDVWTESSSGTHTHTVNIPAHTHTVNIPAHTHETEFAEVKKDTAYPENLSVKVNGMTSAVNLFPDDGSVKYVSGHIVELDITDAVKSGGGDFRKWHQMEITCGAGRGDIAVVFLIDVDISKVRTS